MRYNLWMALSDVGGFHDGIFIIMSLFMVPLSSAIFHYDLTKNNLFEQKEKKLKNHSSLISSKELKVKDTIDAVSLLVKLKSSLFYCFEERRSKKVRQRLQ